MFLDKGVGWGWATSSTWGLLFIRELTERCKKNRRIRKQADSSHLTPCFCVSQCLYEGGGFMQVCMCLRTPKTSYRAFFSSPPDSPALWRKLYFRKHRVWKYPCCLGKNLSRSLVLCTGLNLAVTQLREFRFPLCLCLTSLHRCPHFSDGPRWS